jgi:hypothetical protein
MKKYKVRYVKHGRTYLIFNIITHEAILRLIDRNTNGFKLYISMNYEL